MKKNLKYLGFSVVIALIVMWLAGVFRHREEAYQVKEIQKQVSGLELGNVEVSDTVYYSFSGNIVAEKVAEVSTRIMGKIVSVNVKEGDFVKKGQVLFSVDASDIIAQVNASEQGIVQARQAYNAAKAQLEVAEKTYRRYQELLDKQAITKQEFDQVKAQYESALAQLKQAEAGINMAIHQREVIASNLKYATVVAPFSGYVSRKNVDVGDLSIPGQPSLVIESGKHLMEVFLPEKYLGKVKVGDAYQVYIDSLGKVLNGKVVEVSPSLDPITRSFKVKVSLEDKSLRSGMYATLMIPEKEKAIYVPESAILRRFDFTGVYVVRDDGTLELRYVKLGEPKDGKVRVLSGLEGNERIVVKGIENACDGCKVGGR